MPSGAAGFLSSLPAPRASGGGGKESGRAFIPYTLSKHKPSPSAKPTKAKTLHTNSHRPVTSASDSDDDAGSHTTSNVNSMGGNFFSLPTEPSTSHTSLTGGINATPSIVDNAPGSNDVEESAQPRITAASLYNMSNEDETAQPYAYYDDSSYSNTAESSNNTEDILQSEQVSDRLCLTGDRLCLTGDRLCFTGELQ